MKNSIIFVALFVIFISGAGGVCVAAIDAEKSAAASAAAASPEAAAPSRAAAMPDAAGSAPAATPAALHDGSGMMRNAGMLDDSAMMNAQPASAASQEYIRTMNAMHGEMMSGVMHSDPDTAFVRGMLPHHRGAVDMAKTELKYGKDPELRKLAQEIINAQEKEIEYMQNWLSKKNLAK